MDDSAPIGVFDSGIGGLDVLAELIRLLPNERYVFYGDTGHNPYGSKPLPVVRELTWKAVRFLLERGIKALVVACNTATSAAIEELRAKLEIPVFGIEPAVKPALSSEGNGKVLIMATPLTLSEAKFKRLLASLPGNGAVIPLACPGLAERIEQGDYPGIRRRLRELFSALDLKDVSSVVIGCTHYALVKDEIRTALGRPVRFYDGSEGLARHVQKVLSDKKLLRTSPCQTAEPVEYHFTGGDPEQRTARARAIVASLLAKNPAD